MLDDLHIEKDLISLHRRIRSSSNYSSRKQFPIELDVPTTLRDEMPDEMIRDVGAVRTFKLSNGEISRFSRDRMLEKIHDSSLCEGTTTDVDSHNL